LFVAARDGDRSALARAIRSSQAEVRRFVAHQVGPEPADDVTQDAFLRAFRAIRSYRGESRFTSWLCRITRNCALDVFHRASVESRAHGRAWSRAEESRPDAPDVRLAIEEAISRLPSALREPFVLIEVLGFSYQEASVILATRTGTLKSRMHRARAALVGMLSEGEVADEM
jgi:RNA polymerase sigma-70 factor (ECF subfamily)